MRFSHMSGKEIIDCNKGEKLGMLGSIELIFDEQSGRIETLIIPFSPWLNFRKQKQEIQIPWHRIEKIGEETILINPNDAHSYL
jgi:YlmC/YmxH family sporulation protein